MIVRERVPDVTERRGSFTSVSPPPLGESDSCPKKQDEKYDTLGTWPSVGTRNVNE